MIELFLHALLNHSNNQDGAESWRCMHASGIVGCAAHDRRTFMGKSS